MILNPPLPTVEELIAANAAASAAAAAAGGKGGAKGGAKGASRPASAAAPKKPAGGKDGKKGEHRVFLLRIIWVSACLCERAKAVPCSHQRDRRFSKAAVWVWQVHVLKQCLSVSLACEQVRLPAPQLTAVAPPVRWLPPPSSLS